MTDIYFTGKQLQDDIKEVLGWPGLLDGVTLTFLISCLEFTTDKPGFAMLSEKAKRKLILAELGKLEKKLLVYRVHEVTGDFWFWRID